MSSASLHAAPWRSGLGTRRRLAPLGLAVAALAAALVLQAVSGAIGGLAALALLAAVLVLTVVWPLF